MISGGFIAYMELSTLALNGIKSGRSSEGLSLSLKYDIVELAGL